jgi:hypothetical protein
MAITLNGTTGITTPALDSSGPLTSLGIDDNATSTAITIDANNNVGIGTSSPDVFSRGDSKTLGIQGATTASLGVNAASGSIASIYVGQNGVRAGQIVGASGSMTINAGSSNYLSLGTDFTERMKIDSTGAVTMPYQPAFISFMTVTSTAVIVPFNDASLNRGSGFNTSTYRFTAPVSGVYWFDLRVTYTGAGTNPNAGILYLGINGNRGRDFFEGMPAWTTNTELSSSVIIALTANDYVDIRNPNGGSIQGGNEIYYSLFSGYLIG